MCKTLIVLAIVGLAGVALLSVAPVSAEDGVVVTGANPGQPVKVMVGERGGLAGGAPQGSYVYVPPVPVPPGVIGPNTPLPVALPYPYNTRISRESIIRELLEQVGR